MRKISCLILLVSAIVFSCSLSRKQKADNQVISVFHAGSLSVPLKNVAEAFEKENPGVKVQLEAAGSLACIRKITELNQVCDVLALADFSLIDEMIIPKYGQWNILFARNELCLVYTDNSRRAGEINAGNWFRILMDPAITYGRSDPNSDPCGYRTLLAFKLAANLYGKSPEWDKLPEKDTRFIRGKETDLNSLLESRAIDYMFNYRSVAVQHNFRYLRLPDSINLSDPSLDGWYSAVSVDVRGTSPGSVATQKGASIVYGITIPSNARNPALAEKFVRFLLDPGTGRAIFGASGQNPIEPRYSARSRVVTKMF